MTLYFSYLCTFYLSMHLLWLQRSRPISSDFPTQMVLSQFFLNTHVLPIFYINAQFHIGKVIPVTSNSPPFCFLAINAFERGRIVGTPLILGWEPLLKMAGSAPARVLCYLTVYGFFWIWMIKSRYQIF